MADANLPPNTRCPCGSGRKYRYCCSKRGIAYVVDEAGAVRQSVPLTDDMAEFLRVQRRRFVDRFGRESRSDEPIFFDLPPLEHVEHGMVQAMKAVGLDPAFIHAFEQTGLLVTEDNQHLIPDADLAAWDAAIREYEETHGPTRPRTAGGRSNGRPRYPVGTVALYGPDDATTTKVTAAVIKHEGAEPVLKRWVGTGVATDPKVRREVQRFFDRYGVRAVAASEGNLGCPHEEGEDFPAGGDCPFCPFWAGKQGSNRRE